MHGTTIHEHCFDQELRSLLASLDGLTDAAQSQGNSRVAEMLYNTGLLLAVALMDAATVSRLRQPHARPGAAQIGGDATA